MTDQARRVLEKKGGVMAIDFIRPTGWGKVAEVSVDTNTKGKNTAAYRRLRHDGMSVLVTPQLLGMAGWMRVTTKGVTGKKLAVEFRGLDGGRDAGDGACNVCWAPIAS